MNQNLKVFLWNNLPNTMKDSNYVTNLGEYKYKHTG